MRKLEAQMKSVNPRTGCAQVILWEVNAVMAYASRDYLYLLVAGIIVIIAGLCLSALDIDTDTILMLVGFSFGILHRRVVDRTFRGGEVETRWRTRLDVICICLWAAFLRASARPG